jgi:hypothetical protein
MNEMLAFDRRRIGCRHAVLHHFLAGLDLPTERRNLDDLGSEPDVREAKPSTDDPAIPEELFDLVGMGRRPDVEILRPPPEQQVADASADEIRNVIGLSQPIEYLQRIGIDVTSRDDMPFPRHDPRLHHRIGIVLPVLPSPAWRLDGFRVPGGTA